MGSQTQGSVDWPPKPGATSYFLGGDGIVAGPRWTPSTCAGQDGVAETGQQIDDVTEDAGGKP